MTPETTDWRRIDASIGLAGLLRQTPHEELHLDRLLERHPLWDTWQIPNGLELIALANPLERPNDPVCGDCARPYPSSSRPAPDFRLYVPSEDADLARIAIRWPSESYLRVDGYVDGDQAKATPGMLSSFCRLAETTQPRDFLRFAKKWGVLDLCAHLLPTSHNPDPLTCRPICIEPTTTWKETASIFAATLAISASLHLGQQGRRADWSILETLWNDGSRFHGRDIEDQKLILGALINTMMIRGQVRPTYRWNIETDTIQVGWAGLGLYGALCVELALTVAKIDGWATCSGCHKAYIPRRRPRKGQLNMCDTCRDSPVQWRMQKRKLREKRRQERSRSDSRSSRSSSTEKNA
jgi:hypothetical protein